MFSAKKSSIEQNDIPSGWIFQHYLKLPTKLEGQTYKLRSIFNKNDKDPSMVLFIHSGTQEYKFKCFSSGIYGGPYDLVMHLFDLSYAAATYKVKSDYHDHVISAGKDTNTEYRQLARWEIQDYRIRSWNKLDAEFWSPYNIGSKLLEHYNVKPLGSFVMGREGESSFQKSGQIIYGYFTAKDQLYKVYQPMSKEKKFMSILPNYIQGWDQIQGKPRLFVCSSLKDVMSLRSLGIDGDCIAPQSENSQIKTISHWIDSYPEKYTIFDNDITGISIMKRYKEEYNYPYIHLDLSKDISDSVRDHGARKVKDLLLSLLQ